MAFTPVKIIRDLFSSNKTISDLKAPKNSKPVPSDADNAFGGFTVTPGGSILTKFPFNMSTSKVLKDKDITEEALQDPRLAGEIIEELVKSHSIMQGVMSTFLSLGDNQVSLVAYSKDDNSKVNTEATKKAFRVMQELFRPSDTMDLNKGVISYRRTQVELFSAIRKMLLVRGACYLYVDYREDGTIDLRILDPLDLYVNYYKDDKGNIDPCKIECYQYAKAGHVGLKIQSGLFRAGFNNSPFTLDPESPLLAAVKPIMILEKFTEQLMDMITLAGFPRIEYAVDIEKFLMTVPRGKTVEENNKMLTDSIDIFKESLQCGNHKTVRIVPDWLVPRVMNENASILNADLSQIIDLLTQFVEVSMNLPGTALGTGTTGVNTASVETMLTTKSINYLNSIISDMFQNVIEYILKIKYGITDVFVSFKFDEMIVRTDLDSAGMALTKQSVISNDLKMGIISPEEASLRQAKRLPYDKATMEEMVGSELHAISPKDSIQPGSGPVDRVANPTGTEGKKVKKNTATAKK